MEGPAPSPKAVPADRTAVLRRRCLERKNRTSWTVRGMAATGRSLRGSAGVASRQVRRGMLCRDRLEALRLEVDDLELLLGRLRLAEEGTEEERREGERALREFGEPGGQTGHCELDLSDLFSLGLDGLRERLRGLRAGAADGERAAAYESFLLALDGLSALADHAADVALRAREGAAPSRAAELSVMAASCRRIARDPPASFRDALQLLWLSDLAVMYGDRIYYAVPGRMDRSLAPFYDRDAAAGRMDREEALRLLECLYLLVNELVPDGGAVAVMVGGTDAEGRDATHELSYLCLEAVRRTGLIYPTVGVCWHEGTPRALTDLAVGLMAAGYKTPAFFGDATIRRGLGGLGVPAAQACLYVNSTCVEITPVGASNVWVASPYFNLCASLREELAAQAEDPAPTFPRFLARLRDRLSAAVAAGAAEQDRLRRERRALGGKPLQSVFTRDCVARGRDVDDGGALYNWVECSFVGLANLADSLAVVEGELFDGGTMDAARLLAVLADDFRGHGEDLGRFRGYPRYGTNRPEADARVAETASFLEAECAKHRMSPDGAPFVPGCFTWIMHEMLGRETGATPDGRPAGFPFADGGGPAQGRETRGPTAAVLSATSWDHAPMIGGLAMNLRFPARLFDAPEAAAGLRALLETYLRRGGFEVQVNVVDAEVLRRARREPEAYGDLVVRIGGYCDYFTRLPAGMQEEILQRTEYGGLGGG